MTPPAGPSFQKCPPFKRLWLSARVEKAQLLPGLLSSLCFADLSLEPFGVLAPSRAHPRCSGHWAFRLISGQMCQSQVPLRDPLAGNRGQGTGFPSHLPLLGIPSLVFLARGPLWPACGLEA